MAEEQKKTEPKLVPYTGMVRATVDCCIDRHRLQGEVFRVEMPALWSDDPFEPVVVLETKEDGTLVVGPNKDAPAPVPFRYRKVISVAEDPTPRRASEY